MLIPVTGLFGVSSITVLDSTEASSVIGFCKLRSRSSSLSTSSFGGWIVVETGGDGVVTERDFTVHLMSSPEMLHTWGVFSLLSGAVSVLWGIFIDGSWTGVAWNIKKLAHSTSVSLIYIRTRVIKPSVTKKLLQIYLNKLTLNYLNQLGLQVQSCVQWKLFELLRQSRQIYKQTWNLKSESIMRINQWQRFPLISHYSA